MKYVRLKRAVQAEHGRGEPCRVGPGIMPWELLDVAKHDHNPTEVAYFRSNPMGEVYVTDELDALEAVDA